MRTALILLLLSTAPAWANRVYVSNEKGNDVTVIDSDTFEVLGHYPVGTRPRGITISPDGRELYVCASDDDLVRVYGARSVADPLTLCLPAGSPVGRGTVLEWTAATRHPTGETVLMPLDVAATDYFELSEGYKPFTNLITNGLGAGPGRGPA